MTRRRRRGRLSRVATLSAALAVVVAGLAVAPTAPVAASEPTDPADLALADLRQDAVDALEVTRDPDGTVTAVSSADGEAVLSTSSSSPRRAAGEVLAEHGEVFGIDGEQSEAVVTQTLPSVTGGTVVRAQQEVDGVPVFGGQVVTVLDAAEDVVSVTAETTREPDDVARPEVGRAQAVRAAVAATARARDLSASSLTGEVLGRRVYDPTLLGASPTGGTRPVWEVEVRDGAAVRETVLIGTGRGEVALRFDNAPRATERWICDNGGRQTQAESATVPVCVTPKMQEGDPFESVPLPPSDPDYRDPEVQEAYRHLGATSEAYAALRGTDLTSLVGTTTTSGRKSLVATVRWCVTGKACPYGNAFWDGRQVVLGGGYAEADDVVAHELTHGYVEKTSNLFYFQQSGAINESMADVIGEVVDQRHGGDADPAWRIGEDLPGGALRSMSDPESEGDAARTSSPSWVDEHGVFGTDRGGVHRNSGVGNRTAFLVSQGDGGEIAGIDAGDPLLTKTGVLYLEVIPQLTSGADYAQLGRVLEATCARLAAHATQGFVADDCVSVRQAVAATELAQKPTVGRQPVDVARSCPAGTTMVVAARDDDAALVAETTPGAAPLGLQVSDPTEAGRVLAGEPGQYAVSGAESLVLLDPDGARAVTATSAPLVVPRAAGGSFLHFDHAYSFDQADDSTFNNGGTVRVERRLGDGSWQRVDPLVWANGPDRQVIGAGATPFEGFGGDSRGFGSSRVDLTALAGQTVRVQFRVEGDDDGWAAYGWWLDDIQVYSCRGPAPGVPQAVAADPSGTSVVLRWQPPADGAAVAAYRVQRNGAPYGGDLAASSAQTTVAGFASGSTATVSLTAVGSDGQTGETVSRTVQLPAPPAPAPTPTPAPPAPTVAPAPPPTVKPVVKRATRATATSSRTRVRRSQAFVVRGSAVVRGTTTRVRGVRMTLQRRVAGSSRWATVSTRTTPANGTVRWTVRQRTSTSYRVVVAAGSTTLKSVSAARGVRLVR